MIALLLAAQVVACTTTSTTHERWDMKTRAEPAKIAAVTPVTVAVVLGWAVPHISGWRRLGPLAAADPREQRIYALTGYVRLAKLSTDDCDIHIQMADSPTADPAPQVIAEIPASEPDVRAAFARIWGVPTSRAGRTKGSAAVRITVTGPAFLDLSHQTATPSRAGHAHGDRNVQTLWEIHPVWRVEAQP